MDRADRRRYRKENVDTGAFEIVGSSCNYTVLVIDSMAFPWSRSGK